MRKRNKTFLNSHNSKEVRNAYESEKQLEAILEDELKSTRTTKLYSTKRKPLKKTVVTAKRVAKGRLGYRVSHLLHKAENGKAIKDNKTLSKLANLSETTIRGMLDGDAYLKSIKDKKPVYMSRFDTMSSVADAIDNQLALEISHLDHSLRGGTKRVVMPKSSQEIKNTIGKLLARQISSQTTITKLANKSGVSKLTIERTLAGKSMPRYETLKRLFYALGLRITPRIVKAK